MTVQIAAKIQIVSLVNFNIALLGARSNVASGRV